MIYKRIFFLFTMTSLFFQKVYPQKFIESYYNENMQGVVSSDQARFYSITSSTDSGWHTKNYLLTLKRLEMVGLYEDKENRIKNGHFYWYYPDGKIKMICNYIHNQKDGLSLEFYSDGSLQDSLNYKNGNLSPNFASYFI